MRLDYAFAGVGQIVPYQLCHEVAVAEVSAHQELLVLSNGQAIDVVLRLLHLLLSQVGVNQELELLLKHLLLEQRYGTLGRVLLTLDLNPLHIFDNIVNC